MEMLHFYARGDPERLRELEDNAIESGFGVKYISDGNDTMLQLSYPRLKPLPVLIGELIRKSSKIEPVYVLKEIPKEIAAMRS